MIVLAAAILVAALAICLTLIWSTRKMSDTVSPAAAAIVTQLESFLAPLQALAAQAADSGAQEATDLAAINTAIQPLAAILTPPAPTA